MAARAMTLNPINTEQPRERRKRESFAPLDLLQPSITTRVPPTDSPRSPMTARQAAITGSQVPFTIGNSGEPAFHEVEEAFFKAGTEPTLQRNEGDEYETSPGFFQRLFRKAE